MKHGTHGAECTHCLIRLVHVLGHFVFAPQSWGWWRESGPPAGGYSYQRGVLVCPCIFDGYLRILTLVSCLFVWVCLLWPF